jgi:hypothetical protein
MKSKLILGLALVLSGGLVGCSTAIESPRQYLVSYDPSERSDILSYSKPSSESLRQIKVERVSLTKEQLHTLNALPKSKTENGMRWLVEEKPDTMRDGPWNTRLYIFERDDTNHCVRVELIDHAIQARINKETYGGRGAIFCACARALSTYRPRKLRNSPP